jgi:hypothetical protein
MVAGIDKNLACQVKALLRSVRDQDFIGRDRQTQPFFIAFCNELTERKVSFCCRVLEDSTAILFEHLCSSLADSLNINKSRVREPAGKRNNRRIFGDFQDSRINDLGGFAIRPAKCRYFLSPCVLSPGTC